MNLLGHYLSTPLEGGPSEDRGQEGLVCLGTHRYTQVPRYHTAGLCEAEATLNTIGGSTDPAVVGVGVGRVPLGAGQKEAGTAGPGSPEAGMGGQQQAKVRQPAKEHELAQRSVEYSQRCN